MLFKKQDIGYRTKKGLAVVENNIIEDFDYNKPWGFYNTFVRNQKCTVKVLFIKDELSLQMHKKRDEIWFLAAGCAEVYRNKLESSLYCSKITELVANLKERVIYPGDGILIKKGTVHSAKNLDKEGSLIVEISLGIADENDIVRFYDKNNRINIHGLPQGLSINKLVSICRKKSNVKTKVYI